MTGLIYTSDHVVANAEAEMDRRAQAAEEFERAVMLEQEALWLQCCRPEGAEKLDSDWDLSDLLPSILQAAAVAGGQKGGPDYEVLGRVVYRTINERFRQMAKSIVESKEGKA